MNRVVRFHQYGDPSVLTIEKLPSPEPAPGEVRIKVHAIGLNRAESMFRRGEYLEEANFPSGLGYEASGIVDAVGSGVENFKAGDRVSLVPPPSVARWGTYAEQAVVPADFLVKHPSNISQIQAAALWMQYLTAWGALITVAKLKAGEFVLITAASSSVGLAAIQIAKRIGAVPIAVTRSLRKTSELKKAGADHVIVSDEEDLAACVSNITNNQGVRVVLDPIGGPGLESLAKAASRGAIIIEYGALSNAPSSFPLINVLSKSLTVRGYLLHETISDPDLFAQGKAFVLGGLEDHTLSPIIAKIFPFTEITQAHQYLENGEQFGKIIVTVAPQAHAASSNQ